MAVQMLDKTLVMKQKRSSMIQVQKELDFGKIDDSDSENIYQEPRQDRFDEIITLPPLRERKDDIPLLVEYCINMECKKRGLPGLLIISDDLLEAMMDYNWPGNVRALFKFIAKLVRKFGSTEIGLEDLPERFTDLISAAENEYDFLLPDLPLIDTDIDKITEHYKNEILKYPNSRSIKGIKNLAHYRGNQNGLIMAEAFQVLRIIK